MGLAMGGAQVASAKDATAGYWNPAGLTGIKEQANVGLMHADYFGGIAKYDGTTWIVYTPSNSGLPTTEVKDIDVDAQNNIWIGCNLGLIKFDGLNWVLFTAANSGLSVNNGVKDVEVDEVTNKVYAVTVFSVDIYDNGIWSHINSSNSPIVTGNLAEVDAHGDTVIVGLSGSSSGCWIFEDRKSVV